MERKVEATSRTRENRRARGNRGRQRTIQHDVPTAAGIFLGLDDGVRVASASRITKGNQLADLRRVGIATGHIENANVTGNVLGSSHRPRGVERKHGIRVNTQLQRLVGVDTRGGTGEIGSPLGLIIASNGEVFTLDHLGGTGDETRGRLGQRDASDLTSGQRAGVRVGRKEIRVGDVLGEPGIEAKDTAQTSILQSITTVAAFVGLDEHRVLKQGRLTHGRKDQVALSVQGRIASVELLTRIQHNLMAGGGRQIQQAARTVRRGREKLMEVTQHGTVDRAGNRSHRRHEVDTHQVLEGHALLTIFDDERIVEPLVERDRNVGRRGVLLVQRRGGVVLPANLEVARSTGVDSIAEAGDGVLVIAVNQLGDNHLLFELHQTFHRPLLGDEGVIVVGVARHLCGTEVERIHLCGLHSHGVKWVVSNNHPRESQWSSIIREERGSLFGVSRTAP